MHIKFLQSILNDCRSGITHSFLFLFFSFVFLLQIKLIYSLITIEDFQHYSAVNSTSFHISQVPLNEINVIIK